MKKPPKGFTVAASNSNLEGLKKQIATFYGGEEKELQPIADRPGYWSVHSMMDKRRLSTLVLQTSRGFYFGWEDDK